ncbi:bifunctional diguanylate cyclase/phosphodiesterase [Azohydromonas australica]|uniref:bifunctional diguanylate cyclase/phosphodiesterase n=1 Tax=Azohydromonas australica TaxID=364039 RepID=UPI0003F4B622|nr:EAL domain-containing protein [Azohydromonas australica]
MSPLRRIGDVLRWPRGTLALQLTGVLLLISILPLLIYYVVSYRAAERTILDVASQQGLQTLRNQRDYLVLQFEQVESLAANLSQIDEITNTLSRINNNATRGSIYDSLATKARIGYLLSNYRNLGGLVSIDIFTLDGTHFHVGDTLTGSNERSELRNELLERTLRSNAFVTWHGVEDNIEKASSSQKVLAASKMLVSARSSWLRAEPVAMLLINYSTDYLHERLSTVSIGPGASLMVLDEQRRLIYHPDKNKIGQPVAAEFAALLEGSSGSFTQRLGDDDVLLSYEVIPEKNWYVLSIIPKQTLLAPMADIRRVAGVMLLFMMLLVLVLLRLFAMRIVEPIGAIAQGFKNFQINHLAPGWRMPRPRSLKPIADLAQWFNTFLDHMDQRKESETRLRIAATAFEAQEGMLVLDADVRILQANGAQHAVTGHAADEIIGHGVDMLGFERHGASLFPEMRRTVECTGSWKGEVWSRRKNGERYPAWVTLAGVRDERDVLTHFVVTLTDITERKASEEENRKLAFYDPLTGLPNRRLLMERLRQAMLDCPQHGQSLALMFLDLDKFKTLNDTLGHDVGDALLCQVAQRLVHCVREVDTVARLGGDEFVVLIEGLDERGDQAAVQAEGVALKIMCELNQDYEDLAGEVYHSTSSIGIAIHSDVDSTLEELMKQADIALYQAKEAGRNTLRFFEPAMQARLMARAALEQNMRRALAEDQFKIYLQPKVDVHGSIVGAEALVRWEQPGCGIVPPQSFIALAEETGLIVQLGEVVLRKACKQLVTWAGHPRRRHLGIAVNVSPREFRHAEFVANVLRVVEQTGADPARLTLEITESLFVDDVKDIVAKMNALRQRGISFALDDFGTGYSSLAYLKEMPLQELKIDRSFVNDVLTDASDATIARAVIAMGHELGIEVVAEGIETAVQYEFLRANGCRLFQGYFFSPPIPPEKFHQLLEDDIPCVELSL